MKRILATVLLLACAALALVSCGESKATLGLGTNVSHTGSDAANGAPAVGESAVTVAAVILWDGRIADLALCAYKAGYTVSQRGVYTAGQVGETALTADLIGKSASEIEGMTGLDASVKAAVLDAIADAGSDAAPICKKTDKAGISATGSASGKSADFYVGDGVNGEASTDATYAAVALDADGKVSAAQLDAVQVKRKFGADGKLAAPTETRTKRELGYDYGMRGVSASYGIGKEWFEQAAHFCSQLLGKTAGEIGAISLSGGKATDAALLSGCTIAISDFVTVARAAAENAN